MFEKIIRFSIDQRWMVLLMTLAMAVLGVYNYQKLPIDAVPDITNVQVQVNTSAPGYSPLEAEQRAGRAIWWDKKLDRSEQANYLDARVPQQPYVYGTSGRPNSEQA